MHIVQRGVERRASFRQEKDYRSYLAALLETSDRYGVAVHAYVLMTNHVHMLVSGLEDGAVSRLMQQLGRKYVTYFNREHHRRGALWEGRFRSSLIDSEHYLLACYRYIELNPVRAGIVTAPHEYQWSSYRFNGIGLSDDLVTPRPEWLALGSTAEERTRRYRRLFDDVIAEVDDDIRVALHRGLSLQEKPNGVRPGGQVPGSDPGT